MFCITFQVLLKVFTFFLVEIQLFSAQKQMSFRRRIFGGVFSMPYIHPPPQFYRASYIYPTDILFEYISLLTLSMFLTQFIQYIRRIKSSIITKLSWYHF